MMSCRKTIELLGEYVDGELPWHRRLWLKTHLLLCRACSRYTKSYRITVKLVARLKDEDDAAGPAWAAGLWPTVRQKLGKAAPPVATDQPQS